MLGTVEQGKVPPGKGRRRHDVAVVDANRITGRQRDRAVLNNVLVEGHPHLGVVTLGMHPASLHLAWLHQAERLGKRDLEHGNLVGAEGISGSLCRDCRTVASRESKVVRTPVVATSSLRRLTAFTLPSHPWSMIFSTSLGPMIDMVT